MVIAGRALKYPQDDVNTDVIWPGRYTYVQMAPEQMRAHAMETFDPDFGRKVQGHPILVVGRNFGCGSSREQASECLKHAGVEAILGRSFARLFYRNSVNLGLPVVESDAAVDAVETGASVRLDLAAGEIAVDDAVFRVPPLPPRVLQLLRDGGLLAHLRRRR